MRKVPRWYQNKTARKIIKAIIGKPDVHPIGVVPTGAGKSLILCIITEMYLDKNIEKDVLILSHRSTILEQDLAALEEYFPDIEIGLNSAGLGSRTKKKITVAGIQSIWRNPEMFNNVGLVIIDEAHLVNTRDMGMYREFLGYLDANYVGLTATHFRLGHGYIHKGEETLFNYMAYDLSSLENYNKLVKQGYLSKMFSKKTKLAMEVDGVKKRGGDFTVEDLSKKFDRDSITEIACKEIAEAGRKLKLKKWLLFAIDQKHAENISKMMNSFGIRTAVVHSKIKVAKEVILEQFKSGIFECIVSVEMLTTGLDIPEIDLIGCLRPTESASLHVQMLGRGSRPLYAEGYDITVRRERLKAIRRGGKKHCIVMDFAGNVARLGPINNVIVKEAGDKKLAGNGEAITKVCPDCEIHSPAQSKFCDFCGHEFEFKTRLQLSSSDQDIISEKQAKEEKTPDGVWYEVRGIEYKIHSKKGKTSSLCVTYHCGMRRFSEYVCIDHGGYARQRANAWVAYRVHPNERKPRNLIELFAMATSSKLKVPKKVLVSKNGKWSQIEKYEFSAP